MKKILICFFYGLIILTACNKSAFDDQAYVENEFASEKGWEIVSLTVYNYVYDDELEENVYAAKYHYNNVGHLDFNTDGTGVHTYEGMQYDFDWSLSSGRLAINFNYEEISDYSAPFVYYSLFGSDFNDPNISESVDANAHELLRLTENSLLCSKSNAEFIINKVL